MSMEICGIKFVAWNTSLREHLEALTAGGYMLYGFSLLTLGPYVIYYVLQTQFWAIAVIYLIWLWLHDNDTPAQGGRRSEWVLSWKFFEYAKKYFPITLIKSNGVELEPQRNYLFAAFPHGIMPTGATVAFASNACNFTTLFPHHKSHIIMLDMHFKVPIYRDFVLSRGCCSSSAKSLKYLLGHPKGGHAPVLFIGGVSEQMNSHPGMYEVVVKNRKGFVKLALQNGSPLVPVFSFGENDVYTQLSNPRGSWVRNFQEWCKEKTAFIPVFINGRGLFQYNFGIIPRKTPINVVVGKPIDVVKVENPTQEQIDTLHSKFIEELTNLFEDNKHQYATNPETIKLVIT